MLKPLNLTQADVKSFILGEKSDLRSVVERIFVAANEGVTTLPEPKFAAGDAKVVYATLGDIENRIEILKAMAGSEISAASEGATAWLTEFLSEDKSRWVAVFNKKINECHSTAECIKVVEEIDDKIDDCKDVLEDNITARSLLRALIKAGVITIGASVAGGAGIVVGVAAALANSSYINKSKTMVRQVQNELFVLRRKALAKRDQLRKSEYHDHRDEGTTDDISEDDDSYGNESVAQVYKSLMDL